MSNSDVSLQPIRAHVLVSGRVQGVGYRASTYEVARHLQLKGWVRNLRDGRVEAVFEGTSAAVDEMIRWCHQGPSAAIVDAVAIDYETLEGLEDFYITK